MSTTSEYYRADGVRITHNPDAPGMAEKYGERGNTDPDGFDPHADSVGAGIYGGKVLRDDQGNIAVGRQYQNHNTRPGPVYAGTGYTEMSQALGRGPEAVAVLLDQDASLVSEISTGGATPLHMCGMSQRNQLSTALLVARGADIEAVDTYGFRPLHRMASNNLALGAKALLEAGADIEASADGLTPTMVAMQAAARDVLQLLRHAKACSSSRSR
jgi:hypothetical protein